jgi:hypothetical protein
VNSGSVSEGHWLVARSRSKLEETRMRLLLAVPILILLKLEQALVLHMAKRRVSR